MRISDWSSDVCSSDLPPKEAGRMPRRALQSIFIVMAPSQTVSGNGVERHDRRFLERAVFVDVVARGFSTDGHQITVNAEYLAADIDQRHLRLGETLEDRKSKRLNSSH